MSSKTSSNTRSTYSYYSITSPIKRTFFPYNEKPPSRPSQNYSRRLSHTPMWIPATSSSPVASSSSPPPPCNSDCPTSRRRVPRRALLYTHTHTRPRRDLHARRVFPQKRERERETYAHRDCKTLHIYTPTYIRALT